MVEEVRYPGLASHPQRAIVEKQMALPGGLLSFDVAGGLEAGRRFVEVGPHRAACALARRPRDARDPPGVDHPRQPHRRGAGGERHRPGHDPGVGRPRARRRRHRRLPAGPRGPVRADPLGPDHTARFLGHRSTDRPDRCPRNAGDLPVPWPAVPELIEIEYYRRLAEKALGRTIASRRRPDGWFLKRGTTATMLESALVGQQVVAARRRGKLLLLDMSPVAAAVVDGDAPAVGPTLGLRFGMTGRLIVDDSVGVERLEYASSRSTNTSGIDFALHFDDGGVLRIQDARRLGGVELEPDESRLGPDASDDHPERVRRDARRRQGSAQRHACSTSRGSPASATSLPTRRSGGPASTPHEPAGSLSPDEVRRLHRHLRSTLRRLLDRGGSHLGGLQVARLRGGRCPRDGAELERRTIGGRTTYSCPAHQH